MFTKSFLDIKKLGALVLCVGAFGFAQAEEMKVGYIDAVRITQESAPFKAARSKLEAEFSKRQKEMNDMRTRLKTMGEKLEKDMPVLADSDKVKRQREMAEAVKEFETKGRKYQEDYSRRFNEERSIAGEKVNKVIQNIAKTEKYDLILQDGAAYVTPKVDITDKVLRSLGGSSKGGK